MLESFFRDPTKLPQVPAAVDPTDGNFRWPFVVLMVLGGIGGIGGALIAALVGANGIAAWLLVGGIVCVVFGNLAIPRK